MELRKAVDGDYYDLNISEHDLATGCLGEEMYILPGNSMKIHLTKDALVALSGQLNVLFPTEPAEPEQAPLELPGARGLYLTQDRQVLCKDGDDEWSKLRADGFRVNDFWLGHQTYAHNSAVILATLEPEAFPLVPIGEVILPANEDKDDVHCECDHCENTPDTPADKVCEVCDKHFCNECLYECSHCKRIVCCDCGRACDCGADYIACPDPECRKGCPDCHGMENPSTPTAKGE